MHELTGPRKVPAALRKFGLTTGGFQLFLSAFRVLERVFFDFPNIVLSYVCMLGAGDVIFESERIALVIRWSARVSIFMRICLQNFNIHK